MYTVYKHTAPNGKVYIGITKINPLRRWRNGYGYKGQEYFYRAILKYGWDNFKHEILYTGLTKEQAQAKEIELIELYKATDSDYGYNIHKGGNAPNGRIHEVICINTGEVFETAQIASQWAGVSYQLITEVCRINKHTAGKHPVTGEPLKWAYK